MLILSRPHLLNCLHTCLSEGKGQVRRPAVASVLALAQSGRQELNEVGIVSTLRHICDGVSVSISPGGIGRGIGGLFGEDDRVVVEEARQALNWLEHGGPDEL
jgi:armadillo repeat-containing protein 8